MLFGVTSVKDDGDKRGKKIIGAPEEPGGPSEKHRGFWWMSTRRREETPTPIRPTGNAYQHVTRQQPRTRAR